MPTYGVFDLTGKTIGIIAVVTVLALAIAVLLYYIDALIAGVIFHATSFAAVMVGLITWWSFVDWSGGSDGFNGFGTCVGSAIVLVVWLVMPAGLLYEKLKARCGIISR